MFGLVMASHTPERHICTRSLRPRNAPGKERMHHLPSFMETAPQSAGTRCLEKSLLSRRRKLPLHGSQPPATHSRRRPSAPKGTRKVAFTHRNFAEALLTKRFDRNKSGRTNLEALQMPAGPHRPWVEHPIASKNPCLACVALGTRAADDGQDSYCGPPWLLYPRAHLA